MSTRPILDLWNAGRKTEAAQRTLEFVNKFGIDSVQEELDWQFNFKATAYFTRTGERFVLAVGVSRCMIDV